MASMASGSRDQLRPGKRATDAQSEAATRSQTLFSAVISRSNATPHSNKKSRLDPSYPDAENLYDASKEVSTTTSGSAFPEPKITTPTTSKNPLGQQSRKRSPMMVPSPGGYEILKALDGANLYAYHEKESDPDGDLLGGNDVNPAEEWHDATIYFSSSDNYDNQGEAKENLTDILNAEKMGDQYDQYNPLQSSIVEATRQGTDLGDIFQKKVNNALAHPESCGLGVMDWSLKRRIRLECLPGRCLPAESLSPSAFFEGYSTTMDEGQMHQLALQYLSRNMDGTWERSSSRKKRDCSPKDAAMAKWLASTMYYQHPAVHPLPNSLLLNDESSFGHAASTADKLRGQDLSSFIVGPQSVHNRVRLSAAGCMGSLGNSMPQDRGAEKGDGFNNRKSKLVKSSMIAKVSTLLDQRRCDWQEAFRSMYRSWKSKLNDIERSCVEGGRKLHIASSTSTASSQDEMARCSFYMILPHQVILFRGGFVGSDDDLGHQQNDSCSSEKSKNCIVPMIVFSSTTAYLRSKLRSMGVELRLFAPNKDDGDVQCASHEVFSGSVLETDNQNTIPEADAEAVHADLDAIKGGATVDLKKRKQHTKYGRAKNTEVPPLFVRGNDDCSAVYELLMNTYGLSANSGTEQQKMNQSAATSSLDVPLLLCRSLGPCMHTALRTLSISGLTDNGYANQLYSKSSSEITRQGQDQHEPTTTGKALLELRGPVLPCALRDLTCAMVDFMLLDKYKHGQHNGGNPNSGMGSHQFVMILQPHEGEHSVSAKTSTGSSSSIYFNGSNIPLTLRKGSKYDATLEWFECNHGDFVNVLVWDISRKSVVNCHPLSA